MAHIQIVEDENAMKLSIYETSISTKTRTYVPQLRKELLDTRHLHVYLGQNNKNIQYDGNERQPESEAPD